jgi:hypothetical protein
MPPTIRLIPSIMPQLTIERPATRPIMITATLPPCWRRPRAEALRIVGAPAVVAVGACATSLEPHAKHWRCWMVGGEWLVVNWGMRIVQWSKLPRYNVRRPGRQRRVCS